MVKEMIAGRNKCTITENGQDCTKGKKTQTIEFSYPDD